MAIAATQGTVIRDMKSILLAVSLLLGSAVSAEAVDKRVDVQTLSNRAEVIVVGELSAVMMAPWFDGWHIWGKIAANEIISGRANAPSALGFRFVCSCCSLWNPPHLGVLKGVKGLWFLKSREKDGTWQPAGDDCSDLGFRPVNRLDLVRKALRRE